MTNMERKRKFKSTCMEIKLELRKLDPLGVGIYEEDEEALQNQKKKLKEIQIKLRDAASDYENVTTRYNKHEEFKSELQNENLLTPELRKEYLSAPTEIIELYKAKKAKVPKKLVVLNADFFFKQSIIALADGLKHDLYPQVVRCFSHLVNIRPNDIGAKKNKGEQRLIFSTQKTHKLVMIDGGLNLVVFTPSKARIDMGVEEKKLKFPPYVTPVLCRPEFYGLMQEALLFQQNEEKAKMPTWCTVKNYRDNVPMGADISNAWNRSTTKGGVSCCAEMADKYKWHDAILEVKEQGTDKEIVDYKLKPYDARHLTAACIYRGIYAFDDFLQADPRKAVDVALGHVENSDATHCYLDYVIRDGYLTPIPNMMLKAANSANPIIVDGVSITKGVYCLATKSANQATNDI